MEQYFKVVAFYVPNTMNVPLQSHRCLWRSATIQATAQMRQITCHFKCTLHPFRTKCSFYSK